LLVFRELRSTPRDPRPQRGVTRRGRATALALALAAAGAVAACDEKLDAGAACPVLCPDQDVPVRDTVIEPVVLDTTLFGFPTTGDEAELYVASRGDSVQTRGIFRFDSLPTRYVPDTAKKDTVLIAEVDSASFFVHLDTTRAVLPDRIAFDLYDVDADLPDSATAAVDALFADASRFLGATSVRKDSITDTLRVLFAPEGNARLLAKIRGNARLRVGVRVRSEPAGASAAIRMYGGQLRFRVSQDTGQVKPILLVPESATPVDSAFLRQQFADYTLVVKGTPPPPAGTLGVGGLPGRRALLRFDVPRHIIDSTTIVRAMLLLTQTPFRQVSPADTFTIYPAVVAAGVALTDLGRAARLITPAGFYGIDSLRLAPGDTGVRSIRLVTLLRVLRGVNPDSSLRAIVLRSSQEGQLPLEVRFFSAEAPSTLRPRLELSYIPRVNFGLP
jgi:hypothetical protein